MPAQTLIVGNWKMNGLNNSVTDLAQAICADSADISACQLVVAPPVPYLSVVAQILKDSKIALSAQTCATQPQGAHTGDVAADMLQDLGCDYVIVGHSERRADHGETNEIVAAQAAAAIAQNLTAIICVGETLAERDAGKTIDIVSAQILKSLPENISIDKIVIAYEPVWAIGTGKTPSAQDVADVHAAMRSVLCDRLGEEAHAISLLYGGSVKPGNAAELLALENVNGALIGGASLKAGDFLAIAKAV